MRVCVFCIRKLALANLLFYDDGIFFLGYVSYKKSNNNAQAGQSRVSGGIVNSDSNKASPASAVQNGAHSQPPLPGLFPELCVLLVSCYFAL